MENVLYEYRFDTGGFLSVFIPLIIGLTVLVAAVLIGAEWKRRVVGIILFIVAFVLCGVTVSQAANMISDHVTVSKAIENGTYKVVEGYVSDFKEPKDNEDEFESFKINNVVFNYYGDSRFCGYHIPKSKGGVITGDGQYLTVKYVVVSRPANNALLIAPKGYDYQTVIIYIAEKTE